MNPYAKVDEVIAYWVNASGSTLFTEWAGGPSRFFHIAGVPPCECFQVNIFPPFAERIEVFARAIDTNDDTEFQMQKRWEGQISELGDMIASAIEIIERWKLRSMENGANNEPSS